MRHITEAEYTIIKIEEMEKRIKFIKEEAERAKKTRPE